LARDIPVVGTNAGVAPFMASGFIRVAIFMPFPGIALRRVGALVG
jgi:hypothetical protein